jgi:hypothetical protein
MYIDLVHGVLPQWGGSSPLLPLGDGRSYSRTLAVTNENKWRRSMRLGGGGQ